MKSAQEWIDEFEEIEEKEFHKVVKAVKIKSQKNSFKSETQKESDRLKKEYRETRKIIKNED